MGDRIGFVGQNDAIEFGFIDTDTVQIYTAGGGTLNFDFISEIIPDEWVYLVAVGDGTELRLYVDGVPAAFGGAAIGGVLVPYGDSDYLFNIGGGGIWDDEFTNNGNQFTGALDEIAVWDTALNPTQIQAHFNAALTSEAILIGENTWIGDANLDGEFNSGDMVQVFVAGKYETTENATWGEGDWNGDQQFTSGDMVAAFADGGYEQGLKQTSVSAVPEPGSVMLALLGLIGVVGRGRRGHR